MDATSPASPERPARSGLRRAGWFLGGTLVLVGGSYLGGRLHVQPRIDALEAQVARLDAELAQARSEVASLRGQVGDLEARRRLAMAVSALDAHNFGIAKAQLEVASKLLANSTVHAGLAAQIRGLELVPTGDTEAQHAALVQLGEAFDHSQPSEPASETH